MTVHVIATGGTIASHFDGRNWTNIDGGRLVDEAGPHAIDVVVEDVATGPSSNLTSADMVRIAARARDLVSAGSDGVVVTHGTDTMELTSFVAALIAGVTPRMPPIVFTGSMRVHSHRSPDGPRNLRDAIATAAAPEALGCGVLVCAEGVLHDPLVVTKTNANAVDAFTSAPLTPVGSISGGHVVIERRPSPRAPLAPPNGEVPLLTCYPDVAAAEFARLAAARAVVVEGFGDLNVPQQLWAPIRAAADAGVMVVLASRAFTATADDAGLDALGAIGAGGLTAQKARLAAMSAVNGTPDRDRAIELFRRVAVHYDPADRGTS